MEDKNANKTKNENIKSKFNVSSNNKNSGPKSKDNTELLVKDLKEKLKDAEDKLLRSLAENDNLRKRHEKEIEDNSKYAIKNLSYSLLSVVDNLERAISAAPDGETQNSTILKNLVIGIQAVEKDLYNALEQNGVTKFDSLDKKFDPEIHQAVSKVNNEKPDGIIVEEMQKGFKIGARLLRPAMVVVSMGPEKSR